MSIPIKLNPIGFDTWFVKVTRAFNNSIGEPGKVRLDYIPGDEPVLEVFVNLDVSLIAIKDLKVIARDLVPSGVSVEWYWENGLPMSYMRAEWIETVLSDNNNAPYLYTGITPTSETSCKIRCMWTDPNYISSHVVFWFLPHPSGNGKNSYSLRSRSNSGPFLSYDYGSQYIPWHNNIQQSRNTWQTIETRKNTLWTNGTLRKTFQLDYFTASGPLYTNQGNAGIPAGRGCNRISELKIWNDNEDLANYIPAFNSLGETGMYDTVSKSFKVSANKTTTVQFTVGLTLQQVRDMKLDAPGSISLISLSIPCEVYNDSEAWGAIEAAQQKGWTFTFYWRDVVDYLTPHLNDIIGNGNYTIAYDYQTNKLNLAFALSVTDEQLTEVESLLDRVLSKNIVIEIDPFPIDCTRVEYLESTGLQYINTEYYLEKADDYVMVDVAEVRRPQYWGAVWGTSNDAGPSYNLELKYYNDNTKFRVFYGDKYTYGFWEQLGTIPSNRNLYVNDGGQWSCNGISVGTLYPPDFKCTAPASLFCIYNGTNPGWSRSALRIFGFEIRRAGESTLNFIPALDPTGVACMFDSLTRKAFRNGGTGQFIAGVETQQQLDAVLSGLPDRTGQDGGEIHLRLSDTLYDAAVASGIIEKTATAKNWQIAYDPTTITEAT